LLDRLKNEVYPEGNRWKTFAKCFLISGNMDLEVQNEKAVQKSQKTEPVVMENCPGFYK
jgi:hypothetical protein